MLADAGLARVEIYIQSGNIVFESAQSEAELWQLVARQIVARFCISTRVTLRTAEELARLVGACPFSAAEIAQAETMNTEGESFYVALLPPLPPRKSRPPWTASPVRTISWLLLAAISISSCATAFAIPG